MTKLCATIASQCLSTFCASLFPSSPLPTVPFLSETLPFMRPQNSSVSKRKRMLHWQGLGCGEGFMRVLPRTNKEEMFFLETARKDWSGRASLRRSGLWVIVASSNRHTRCRCPLFASPLFTFCDKNITDRKKISRNYFPITDTEFRIFRIN